MDTFTLLGRARLEVLEDLAEEAKSQSLVDIYHDDHLELDQSYAATVSALIRLMGLAESLIKDATAQYSVRKEGL